MCIIGKCSEKPISYPNLKRLEKNKTTHANVKCDNCDKIFSAKRNLKRHCKNVHKTQDDSTNSNNDNDDNNSNPRNDPLTEMVERAEILIQWQGRGGDDLQHLLTTFNIFIGNA